MKNKYLYQEMFLYYTYKYKTVYLPAGCRE